MQHKCKEIASTVFGTIHSNRTVVVLLDKQKTNKQALLRLLAFNVSYTLSTFFNSIKHYHKSYIRCYEQV